MGKQNRWSNSRVRLFVQAAMVMFAAMLSMASLASGQFIKFTKPKVPVTISHPAGLGITLAGKKVAFGQASGTCGQQFADALMQEFVKRQVTLVNRGDLDAILAEHHFQVSSSVDPATAVQLGKVLGPAVMVFVNVSRCDARRREPLYQDAFVGNRINISRTEAHFLASVHTVDLASGRELAVNTIQTDPYRENQSQTGIPEYPSEYEVQDEALREASRRAEHLYFPWTETREVSFMNSKECNLRQAYDLLRANDREGALKVSQQNVELCKSDPKTNHQADAWYNLGVAYMLVPDYDNALMALGESQRLHSDKTVLETIAECREAKASAIAVAQREQATTQEQAAQQEADKRREAQAAKSVLTNDYVVKLLKNGMSAEIVVKMIASQPAKFSTAPDDLLALKQAGVPDSVIAAMLDKK